MMVPPILVQAAVFFYVSQRDGGDVFHLLLAVAMLTSLGAVSVFVNTHSNFVTQGIRLGLENLELVEQLKAQTLAAEEANSAKTKFLAAASHDLRQPAHALNLFVEVLASTELNPHQRKVVGHIRAASEASRDMLSTLLDFSRIEAGVMQATMQPVALAPLLLSLQEEFGLQADAKNLVYRSRDTQAVAHCDPSLLALILRNLLSNAIRYTERGGVLLAVRRRGSALVVQVWDTGVGIAAADQQAVFKEFHQLGNPERDRQKGLGLGLSIAKGLAQTMDARITVHSRPSRGSVFSVWLSMAAAHSAAAKAPTANPLLRGLKVLLVDDEAAVRTSMGELLTLWGCDVREAADQDTARDLLEQGFVPDLLITDYRLREGRTGGEVIEMVRSEFSEQRGLPFTAIIVTGDTSPQRIREAESHGARVLHKPMDAQTLRQAIAQQMLDGSMRGI
jgi:two-component system, sensor histidine kinase